MVEIIGGIKVKSKLMYTVGKYGFGVCMMLIGIAIMTNIISKHQDLR